MNGERIKILRNDLKLTAKEFGEKINVSRSAISTVENGLQPLTDRMAKDICRVYNVNYQWLENGEGNMYSDIRDILVSEISKQFGLDEGDEDVLLAFLNADIKDRKSMVDYIKYILKKGA